jgi:hypothetical protein
MKISYIDDEDTMPDFYRPDVTFWPTEEEDPEPALYGPNGEPLGFVPKMPFGFNRE